jgi:hypothetical protein
MMKVIVVSTWPPSIQMGVTAGIFLASVLLKEMRYLVFIRYLWFGGTFGGTTSYSERAKYILKDALL